MAAGVLNRLLVCSTVAVHWHFVVYKEHGLAENDKQGMGGLQWFHEMEWADYPWEFCAEEYSDKLETWHSSCHNCHPSQQMQSSSQSESRPTFEDDLQQLDNALLPLKADLLNSCVTYANHIEAGIMISWAGGGPPGRARRAPSQPQWP